MKVDSSPLALPSVFAVSAVFAVFAAVVTTDGVGCAGTQDIHETSEAKSRVCFDCHSSAYAIVKTPVHQGVYPTTCNLCHSTTAWIPASQGHPESKFPITTGSHANKAIGCADCHIAALGSDVSGQNTDCVHCHLGAHNTPAIDAVHAGITTYPGSAPTSPPSCLQAGCHPSG
jgi:hypothetical protein